MTHPTAVTWTYEDEAGDEGVPDAEDDAEEWTYVNRRVLSAVLMKLRQSTAF